MAGDQENQESANSATSASTPSTVPAQAGKTTLLQVLLTVAKRDVFASSLTTGAVVALIFVCSTLAVFVIRGREKGDKLGSTLLAALALLGVILLAVIGLNVRRLLQDQPSEETPADS
ncbi:hypothetical protein Dimus_032483 [Dionaea muscipula]